MQVNIQVWLLLVLVLAFAVQAKEAYKIPQLLLNQVDAGNAEVAYFIAKSYLEGSDHYKIDRGQALIWLEKSANMGYAHAMLSLADELNYDSQQEQALIWYERAANLGVGLAFNMIAAYYYRGDAGLDKNCHIAYEWYTKAQAKKVELSFNNHAWNLATSSDKQCRNPEKALKIMFKLMALYADDEIIPWYVWDTKAAVLAAVSDFSSAIELQQWLIGEMQESGAEIKNYNEHLQAYQQRKAWIEN